MYYFLPDIPLCVLWCLLFCKGEMCHFSCCISCSTYVIWFLWHLLWCYFHTFDVFFSPFDILYCAIFSVFLHIFFILFLILSIAFPFTFFFCFGLLVDMTVLISICRSFAILKVFLYWFCSFLLLLAWPFCYHHYFFLFYVRASVWHIWSFVLLAIFQFPLWYQYKLLKLEVKITFLVPFHVFSLFLSSPLCSYISLCFQFHFNPYLLFSKFRPCLFKGGSKF